MKRKLRRNRSGQVLIITSLLVALVLLSTSMYVIDTGKGVPITETNTENVPIEYHRSIRNTVISALSNITKGGNTSILTADLEELTSILAVRSYQNSIKIDITPLDANTYHSGIWISQGTNGQGVSSAYVILNLKSKGLSTSYDYEYAENVTSELNFAAMSSQLDDSFSQVNLTVSVSNEGVPALAQNFWVYLQNSTNWLPVEEPVINSFGNGTYIVSFAAQTDQLSLPTTVFVTCEDQRSILVGASEICGN